MCREWIHSLTSVCHRSFGHLESHHRPATFHGPLAAQSWLSLGLALVFKHIRDSMKGLLNLESHMFLPRGPNAFSDTAMPSLCVACSTNG
jgi:hypothetical protein